MDSVNGSNATGRRLIGMCCLHVDDLFITGTPEFLEKFKRVVKSQFKIGHEDVNDLMFTGQRVKWVMDEKAKNKSHISVEQSLCVSELTSFSHVVSFHVVLLLLLHPPLVIAKH